MAKGASTMWTCMLQGSPGSNFSVRHNKTLLPLPSKLTEKDSPDTLCDKEPHVHYQVEENQEHKCYSSFTVHVVVCTAEENLRGAYSIVWDNQNIVEGSTVSVKLSTQGLSQQGIWHILTYSYTLTLTQDYCSLLTCVHLLLTPMLSQPFP